ncbi:MAG TPA: right-handed parallel beta-helix repeat-containing protein, partial [Candidatus Kryptonia bacterium]|nr:right-handed parallel beta-helix repeat-containing protein [Candidatus Kryptonia bacterium]
MRPVRTVALLMTMVAAGVANASVIDPSTAGDDLGAAVNRALAARPAVLKDDAKLDAVAGALVVPLEADATVRAVAKMVTALKPGEYSVVITGVAADGREVAMGDAHRITVAVNQVIEIVLPAAVPPIERYSVYAGPPGAETLQAQEVAPQTTVRLIDATEFFNRRGGEVPYYPNGPGPPVTVRVVVAAYAGERLVDLGETREIRIGVKQSVRAVLPNDHDVTYAIFASSGTARERLQARGLVPGSTHVLAQLRGGDQLLPTRAQRIDIAAGDYQQTTPIVIDRPEVTLACATPTTIRVAHGFDQSAVVVNPAIVGPHGDNVGVRRLHDIAIENCTWDMTGQIETASAPPPDDFRNGAVMAWATDGLTLRGLGIRDNLRGGLGVLSCSDVRIEGNRIERTRGRAQSDDRGQLLPGRGVGNAINVARNAPFSDPIGDGRQTRTVITNNLIVGDDYGEMYGIVAAAGGATENTISGNTISHVRGACIALEGQNARDSGRTTINGNTCSDTGGIVSDNASGGLADTEMRAVAITGNTISASRAAGVTVSSSDTTVVGNVIDGCQLDSTTSGCVIITPPHNVGHRAGTRNLLVADNVVSLGAVTHAKPAVGVYINGASPIEHLLVTHNRIDCDNVADSIGVQMSGDVGDISLQGNDIGDCGGDGVVVTDFSMTHVKVPQRLTAIDNVFRNLNLSDRWMDGRHPIGAAFRFMIDG